MQPPKLGRRTFLKGNTLSVASDNPRYTGRYFLILNNESKEVMEAIRRLEKKWKLSVATTADFISDPPDESRLKDADALVFNDLGVALVDVDEEKAEQIKLSGTGFLVVPEKVVYIPDKVAVDEDSNRGATWGIEVTGVLDSPYTGAGVKMAVLDTGFDTTHPDFEGRTITTASFAPDETIEDFHGHGTHCTGIACGLADA